MAFDVFITVITKSSKWLLAFVVSVIFVMLLFSINISFSFAEATKLENVKPLLFSVFSSVLPKGQELSQMQTQILEECKSKEEILLPLEGNDSLVIDCDNARSKPISEAIFDSLFERIYYKDYGCKFLGCFKNQNEKDPLFIFSKLANDFFMSIRWKTVIAAVIFGIALLFLGGVKKLSRELFFAGLPFFFTFFGKGLFMQSISSSGQLSMLAPLVSSLTDLSTIIFAIFLAAGTLLFAASFFIRKLKKKEKPKEKQKKKK